MNAQLVRGSDYFSLVRKFPLVPIMTKRQFKLAWKMIDELTDDPETLTPGQEDYLSVLGHLVALYEEQHLPPMPQVSAREMLAFFMQQHELTLSELAREIGGHRSNLSAFMSGKRGLSKNVAMALAKRFHVNVSLFLED